MKKFGMLIVVLIFAGTQMVMAQQQTPPPQQQPQKMAPVRDYIQKNVLPFVTKEQAKFVSALTPEESQQLTKIKQELQDLKPTMKDREPGRNWNNNREGMQGHRTMVQNLMDQVKIIVNAHPTEAAAYKSAIDGMKTKWAADIKAIRDKNGMGNGYEMKNGNRNHFSPFERLSNPAFGLLFNADHFSEFGMGSHHFGNRNMNHRQMGMNNYGRMQGNCAYQHQGMMGCNCQQGNFGGNRGYGMQGRFHGQGRPGMMRKSMNPEVKKELLAYAQKNIFPVLNKERDAFDSQLKNSEKLDIETARKNIADIRTEMKNYWKNNPDQRGQRIGDSARLAMRVNLEKNMLVLNEIVLNHYSQLHASLNNLKQYVPEWKEGIRHTIFQSMKNNQGGNPMGMGYGNGRMMHHSQGRKPGFNRKHNKISPAVRFLLYDSSNPGAQFMPVGK